MISYEVKINQIAITRVDAGRVHSQNEEMDQSGYEYKYKVYDYENGRLFGGSVIHKRQDGTGKLLHLIFRDMGTPK